MIDPCAPRLGGVIRASFLLRNRAMRDGIRPSGPFIPPGFFTAIHVPSVSCDGTIAALRWLVEYFLAEIHVSFERTWCMFLEKD